MKTRITIVAAVGRPHKESRPTQSLRAPIGVLNGGARGATLGGAIPASLARGVCLALLALAGVTRAAAGWTPPESSVTPPAVVTLDAFVNAGGTTAQTTKRTRIGTGTGIVIAIVSGVENGIGARIERLGRANSLQAR